MIKFNMHFEDEMMADLEKIKSRSGTDKAVLIRKAVKYYIANDPVAKAALEHQE